MKNLYPKVLKYYIRCLLLLTLFSAHNSVFAQLPSDFARVEIITGLTNATTFKFAPDGRIFILDRYGELLIYKPSTQSTVSAGFLPTFHGLEDGLIGLAFDPNFSDNNYIYLHYSPLSVIKNRVSRFTMVGDTLDTNSEIVVLEWGTQRDAYYHAAGDMDFDSQGNLIIATGDNSNHSQYATLNETDSLQSSERTSSNTNDLRGKILRITPQTNGSYTIPSGNLFPVGLANTRPEIYVMGARNPYRIFVDKANSDWLFWGEVGPDANSPSSLGPEGLDEINLTKAAGNYGWPYLSGDNEPYLNTYENPQFYYDEEALQNLSTWNTGLVDLPNAEPAWLDFFHESYMAGPRYTFDPGLTDQQRLPIEFDGLFFYWDFNNSQIWAVTMDANGNILNNEVLAPLVFPQFGDDGFIEIQIGPDGHMYILAYGSGCCPSNVGTGSLIRLDYTGIVSNTPPVVTLNADPNNGSLPLMVDFSSVGTYDPDGDSPLTYEWDFDTSVPSTDSTAENPSFTYTVEGTYNAQLRVDDGNGGVGVKNITIYAGNNLASFTFNSPADGGLISWDDDIDIDIDVSDPEDGSTSGGGIDCNDFNVVPSLGHLNHFHDDLSLTGCPQTITLDAEGHAIDGEADIFFVLGPNYTDTGGLTSFDQLKLHPKRKEAEFYDTENGTTIITNTDPWGGGSNAIRVDHDGYISLEGRNLLNITSVMYRVASTMAGGSIEFRVGSPNGTILATTTIPDTGGLNNWVDVESNFTDPGGKNDLYFVFKNNPGPDIFDLNYIEFIGAGVSIDNTPPEVNEVVANTTTELSVEYSEYVTQATAENLANYSLDNGGVILTTTLQPDNRTVILTTAELSKGIVYNLTISGVQNYAGLTIVTNNYPFFIFDSIRVNSGGPQVTLNGEIFTADQYENGGSTFSTTEPIEGTTDDELYQSERFGNFYYDIPIPVPGEYDIRLHFAEIFYGVGGQSGGPGSRVFTVTLEGVPVLIDFDILNEVSPATALVKEFDNVSIVDGFASIQFINVANSPKISGFEILPKDAISPIPDINIASPGNGWDVNQPFDVSFTVENWTIAQGNTHMHYFIDDVMIGPHYSYGPITIDGLPLGNHTIKLELFDFGHTPTGIFDEVTVNVTNQLSCNDLPFPDQWQVHEIDSELPYRSVYILPHDDLDGDGLKDIVTGGWWYKNPGTASGTWTRRTIGAPFNNVAYVYDFDGDGDKDLFGTRGAYTGFEMAWAENDGAGNFIVHTNIPAGTTSWGEPFLAGVAGGEFDGGGLFQLALNWNGAESSGSAVQVLTVPADPVNSTWTIAELSPDSLGEDINEADLDGDGDLDLFQAGNWLRNDGGGSWTTFSTGVTYPTTFDRSQLGDFDRDGDLDAAVGQLGLGSDPDRFEFAWFEAPADPTQAWTKNVLDTGIEGSLSVDVVDMDFDGDLDIIVGEWLGDFELIGFENDLCNSGTWIKHIINPGGGTIDHHDGAQVVDIDNDGDLDIVSIGWNNIVPRIFENTTPLPGSSDPVADAGLDQEIFLPTTSITLNGSGSDPDGGTVTFQWTQLSGPNTATLSGDTTADLTADDLITGTYIFRLTVVDDEDDTDFDDVEVKVTDPVEHIRINSGGPAYTDNGIDWAADQYFIGGGVSNSNVPIGNTSNDLLYQTERFIATGDLVYEVPIANGLHDVNLHFAEIFYGIDPDELDGGIGSRIFNINIENGQVDISNYDIVAEAGGSGIAIVESYTDINVTDGFLTITLTSVVADPKISGIEIFGIGAPDEIPLANAGVDLVTSVSSNSVVIDGSAYDPDGGPITGYQWTQVSGPNTATLSSENTDDLTASDLVEGTYVFNLTVTDDEAQTGSDDMSVTVVQGAATTRINSGGPTFVFDSITWSEDQYFSGGSTFTSAIPIDNTLNDELYQTERFNNSGTFIYQVPVNNGLHNVFLHFAELFYGAPGGGAGGIGSRIFNIDVENGQGVISNYDIVLAAGGSATAVIENFNNINVTDGFLTITLTGVVNNPKISGIEIISSLPPIVDAGEDLTLTLPTNSTVINGTASDPDGGNVTYLWSQESGPATATLSGETTADLTASDLVEGTYIFRLTVTDDEGDTASDEVMVTVIAENQPPVALAEADVTSGDAPLLVNFTGSNSTDDVAVVSYLWDFMDGGATSTDADPSYTFTTPGMFDVSLTVTDGEGLTDTDTITITVTADGNQPPVALAEADVTSGDAPLLVNFTGSNSTDDVGIVSYLWDFMDGGATSTDADPSYTFTTPGTYDVTLTVTDGGGLTDTDIVAIVVTGDNEPPVAVAEANPILGTAPLAVSFTGSNSTDDQGITAYSWDFGDGETSTEADPNHTFANPGEYTVILTVEDADGLTDSDTLTITVLPTDSMEFIIILSENPTQEGLAKLSVLNRPSGTVITMFSIHDAAGRYIGSFDPQQYFVSMDTYELPVGTLRDGVYYVGLDTNLGDKMAIKMVIKN